MIQKAQQRVEEYNFDIRKNVLEYDEVMDEQRKTIYTWRQKVLEREELREELLAVSEEAVEDGVDTYTEARSSDDWDIEGLDVWWLMLPAGLSITLFSAGFFLVGRAMDEVVNPRLRKR